MVLGVDLKKYVGAGLVVYARFAQVHCGRIPGVQAWLEGACLQENMGVGCTISKVSSECWHLLVSAGVNSLEEKEGNDACLLFFFFY